MYKTLVIVSLVILTLASCSKDKTGSQTYHLTAMIDGAKVDFSASLAAEIYLDPSNGHTLSVLCQGGNSTVILPVLDRIIHDDDPITAKTYTIPQDHAFSSYADVNNENYDSDTEFSITIISVTATEIRGTFAGKYVKSGSGDIVNVTAGSFYSKIY